MPLLLEWLAQRYPTARRTTLRKMIESGRVMINGHRARSAKINVSGTDKIEVLAHQRSSQTPPRALPFSLVYEDDDILVIDKPAGLLTSTNARERRPTALAIVKKYVAERQPAARVGLIHRLDRDASGLLVFSKNAAAFESLKRQFYEHTVERIYSAITQGIPNPPEGRIESNLLELPDGRVVQTRHPKRGQAAITEYQVVKSGGNLALLRVRLQTGRKHQIRSQLAQRGTAVLNDRMYGNSKPAQRLMLVASELHLNHPSTGERMSFQIDLPTEFQQAIQKFA